MSVTKPVVGGSTNTWGTILNTALDVMDARIDAAVSDIAARLQLAGGDLSGRLTLKSESMSRVDLGSLSGGISFSLDDGNYFTLTCAGATTWTFADIPAGAIATGWIVKVTNPGAFVITFAAGAAIHWPGGIVPTFTAAGTDKLLFITDDDGTTISASVLAFNQ